MTILFHPCFDMRCRLNPAVRGSVLLDTLTLGPLGLLQELELRLGLTAATTSNLLRTVDYVKLLRNYFSTYPDSPFVRSFEADEFNVAAELLRWRDLLRLAGWKASMRGISERIDLLSSLEPNFASPALGDRWQAVMEKLPEHRLTDWTLELHAPKQLLFPLYERLLDQLERSGVRIREAVQQAARPEQVRRIRVRDFEEAFRGIPTLDPKQWTLICSHGKLLNNVLRLNGCPTTESSIRENDSSVVQLFEAGFSLFIHPSDEVPEAVDIYRLLSYLQARPNPIPSRINLALQRLLTSEAGINPERWQATVDEALAAGGAEGKEEKARIERRLDSLLNPFFEAVSPRAIPLDRLKRYARSLRGWALQRSCLEKKIPKFCCSWSRCATLCWPCWIHIPERRLMEVCCRGGFHQSAPMRPSVTQRLRSARSMWWNIPPRWLIQSTGPSGSIVRGCRNCTTTLSFSARMSVKASKGRGSESGAVPKR